MKVLWVLPSYDYSTGFAGTSVGPGLMCRGEVHNGLDVSVYTTNANGKLGRIDVPLCEPIDMDGVKVTHFHCDFGVKSAFYSSGLRKRLEETVKEFDIVHVSAIWQWIQVDVSRVCGRFNRPYVVSTYGSLMDWGLKKKKWKKYPYFYLFCAKTIKRANALHFVSERERAKSDANFPHSVPSFLSPNCIDTGEFVPEPGKAANYKASLGVSDDTFLISFVSLIRRRKGLHLLVKALSYLKEKKVALLIAGSVRDEKYYQEVRDIISQHDLEPMVRWLGFVKQQDMTTLYSAADIFVLPSYEEAFGIVALEAMACGTPVLVTKEVPVWKEILDNKAGFVIEHNPVDIAEVIDGLAKNKEILTEYGKNARKSVTASYGMVRAGAFLKRAYEDVLTGRRNQQLQWKQR